MSDAYVVGFVELEVQTYRHRNQWVAVDDDGEEGTGSTPRGAIDDLIRGRGLEGAEVEWNE